MGRRALQSYLKYGFIPLEDKVADAFHTEEQTSRTLEYAYDDFCVAQLARDFGTDADYRELMRRSGNWRNVINPKTGWADGRHSSRSLLNTLDLTHRQPFITEGAICHYTWYVPHDVAELIEVVGGPQRFEEKLDSMFEQGLYWHGNEPCHQIAYLYNYIGRNDKTQRVVRHILDTEYNDTPGGLSGNDDAGQMSAWYIFSSLGFYPVCPGTPYYQLAAPTFRRATINLENGRQFQIIKRPTPSPLPVREGSNISQGTNVQSEKDSTPLHIREGQGGGSSLSHSQILQGGTISF
jgi:predicted alpha-1,2-mannosidase